VLKHTPLFEIRDAFNEEGERTMSLGTVGSHRTLTQPNSRRGASNLGSITQTLEPFVNGLSYTN
jgi:hypothetical protein